MFLKSAIKAILTFLHLDVTKNMQYDRLTNQILFKSLKSDSNCIDIGCHKGEILDIMLKQSPTGKHFAFEPIPSMYADLASKYANHKNVTLHNCALSDQNGQTTFQFVKNAPAYSGIKKRAYAVDNPDIEEINVELKKLDDVIPTETRIDFIKIDVEGAEFGVLKGARELLARNKAVLIFEFGKGASDFYGTDPAELYQFLADLGYSIFGLKPYLSGNNGYLKTEFVKHYDDNSEYYFVANKM
ncbi:MAG: FkbM family methyltransferase [Bacteroidetes bacterium]|nr:FkbM family methyltransferase [Bacteroidota bacterium]